MHHRKRTMQLSAWNLIRVIRQCCLLFERRSVVYDSYQLKAGKIVMKDIIEMIVRAVVDYPDQVSVTEIKGNYSSILELSVAKEDMGKIIGKQGRNAECLRTILNAGSAKKRKRTMLEILG
jgi:uncharacterized protein